MSETPKSRHVVRMVAGMPASDGAGVKLQRIIGQPQCDYLDPFLMLDEFRNENADDYIAGFPDHPHRGFETVSYMLHGRLRHRDSVGNSGLLTDGAVQWMTAGRGIIHSEMPEQTDGLLWGYQLWVNLPSELKMAPPRYQDIAPEKIPEHAGEGVRVRVIAGNFAGTAGAAETLTPVGYFDVQLDAGAAVMHPVPKGHTALAYVYDGALAAVDSLDRATAVPAGRLALFSREGALELAAGAAGAKALVMTGEPLNEPVARYGPFVMNTRQELIQAAEDFQNGTFAMAAE
ncbi:MAG: pirin family protein [Alphaproteobacteria bacterium]|jgi:redox-sensitive bicupin YhaK (pirin superfamily)